MDHSNQHLERCRATSKRTKERCARWPTRGASVCSSHGAGAPQVKAAAKRNLLQGELRKTLERFGRDDPITNPLLALQEHAGKVRAWLDFLEERVSVLRHSSQWNTEQIRGEVQLYTSAMKECRETLVDMGKLKIDERLVGIHEATAAMVLDAMRAGLASAGVTGMAQAEAIKVTGSQLRIIQGGLSRSEEPKKASGY